MTGSANAVTAAGVTHKFGAFTALDDVTLDVPTGAFVTLLGPSGSGKSTLLRIIAGLTTPSSGNIFIDGRDVSRAPARARGVGFVFQNYALFPHLSVFENVAYPLRIRRVPASAIKTRVDRALARVNLPELGSRRPAQLSGGQQQRVAVARALVYEPAVLLMDEPLGALDRKLRRHMQIELRQLQQALSISCIYVTHDQEEALTMSDRIVVMRDGRILQVGDALSVYRRPADPFVADFIGNTNLFRCTRDAGTGHLLTDHGTAIPAAATAATCIVAVRPETISIDGTPAELAFPAVVGDTIFAGNVVTVSCTLAGGDAVAVEVAASRAADFHPGQAVTIGWNRSDMAVFAA